MPRADFYLIDTPRFREDPLLLVCELAKRAFAAPCCGPPQPHWPYRWA